MDLSALRLRRRAALVAAVAVVNVPLISHATTRSWTDTNGNWSTTTNWSGSAKPTTGDFAILSKSGNLTCTYDVTTAPFSVGSILLEGNMTLAQGSISNTQLNPGSMIIGGTSVGTYTLSSGTLGATNQIILGQSGGGAGIVLFSGGTISASTMNVGLAGNGTFSQTGGTTDTTSMSVGTSTGNGTLRLDGGQINASGTITIGANGTLSGTGSGAFGTSCTTVISGGIASGTLNNNGTFIVNSTASASTLTLFNTGSFIYNGGDNSNWIVSSSGRVFINADWTAAELLSNSTQTIDFGAHTITLTGGAASVPLSIDGSATLNGGTINANGNGDFEILGATGLGRFTQTSGANNATNMLLGDAVSALGSYTLSGGTLHVSDSEYIGNPGNGVFTQTGGIHSAAAIVMGSGTTTTGTLLVSGGSVTLSNTNGLIIGANANGFLQLSGSGRIDALNTLAGFNPGASGTIEVLGGTFNTANLTLGDDSNTTALMTQTGGTVSVTQQLALGSLNVSSHGTYVMFNGTLSAPTEIIGQKGAGTFTQTGGSNTATAIVFAIAGGSGIYTLSGGTLNVAASIGLNTASQFIQTGGALTLGSFSVVGAIPVPYTFSGGLLHLTASPLNIDASGLLGANVSTSPTRSIIIDQSTTLAPLSLLTIAGGTFSTGSFINNGGSVALSGGTLAVTNSSFTIGANQPLGATVKLDFGTNLSVAPAGLNVDPGALLQVNGGAIYSTGTVTNNGQVLLSAPTSLISSGTFQNNALVSGTGRITGTLNNGTLAEVRVDPSDSLQFQGPGNNSAGKFTLNGGRLEFTQNLLIGNTATVFGRGTLIANGGLTNLGSIVFSGAGNTDVFGNVVNLNRINVTGGNTTTFWGSCNTLSGTLSVNSNSTAVFVGTLAGQSHIVGPGTKDIEGFASGGPIATVVGDTIVEQQGTVSADFLHEDDVTVYGSLQIPPDGTPSHVSQVNTLTIASGTLDLTNNDLIVVNTPVTTVASYIAGAFNNGAWNGAGLTSSSAQAAGANKTALGYATAASVGISTFDGQPVSGSTTLVRYTYMGDANLDGVVNALDFNAVASNFGGTGDQWYQGDFNYDGVVNTLDFTQLSTNFGLILPSPSVGATLVPEPASLAVLLIPPLLRRRRRRRI